MSGSGKKPNIGEKREKQGMEVNLAEQKLLQRRS